MLGCLLCFNLGKTRLWDDDPFIFLHYITHISDVLIKSTCIISINLPWDKKPYKDCQEINHHSGYAQARLQSEDGLGLLDPWVIICNDLKWDFSPCCSLRLSGILQEYGTGVSCYWTNPYSNPPPKQFFWRPLFEWPHTKLTTGKITENWCFIIGKP